MIAIDDKELYDWLAGAAGLRSWPEAGSFVRTIAEAAFRADSGNYDILRPVLVQLKAKYPKYGKEPHA